MKTLEEENSKLRENHLNQVGKLQSELQEFESIVEEKQAIIENFERDANTEKQVKLIC